MTYEEKVQHFMNDVRRLALVRTKGAKPPVTVPTYPRQPETSPWHHNWEKTSA
jgi:hypothetical protein